MSRRRRPLLHHELLLLSLHDRKGTHAFGQMLNIGLGGAIFTELLLDERVRIVEEGKRRKKAFVEVVDASRTHDVAMDRGLEKLAAAKRRARPSHTVSRLAGLKRLRHDVARDLCRMGILRQSEDQVLFVFTRKIYPEVDPGPERALIQRVRDAIEGDGTPDDRTAALVGLADATGTLAAVYDRKQRKALKKRIERLRELGEGSRATRAAVEAAQAAVMAAVTAAAAASG